MGKKKNYNCICGETNSNNFYNKRRGRCKKCILTGAKDKYSNLSESEKKCYIKKQNKWQDDNFLKYRLLSAKSRAKSKNIEFDLDIEFLENIIKKQENKCYYSGIELQFKRLGPYTASIDRLNSSKGYTKDNITFVIGAVNTMKNDLSEEEFFKIIKSVYKKQNQKFH